MSGLEYSLWILDREDRAVEQLDDAASWGYTRLQNQVSTAHFSLSGVSANRPLADARGARVSIRTRYRSPAGAWVCEEDWGGTIASERFSQDANGETYEYTAQHWQQWLRDAIILPTPGQESLDLTGDFSDAAIKLAVRETLTDTDDLARRIPGLTCAGNANQGIPVSYNARYQRLYDAVTTLAGLGRVAFDIVRTAPPGAATWLFRTWPERQGVDRSTQNNVGNLPLVFSVPSQSVVRIHLIQDATAIENTVYLGGAGEGVFRIVELYQDGDSLGYWGRKETFLDARNATNAFKRASMAHAHLQEHAGRELQVDLELPAQEGVMYKRDWNLGDRITCYIPERALVLHADITGVTVEQSPESPVPRMHITLGRVWSLVDRLAAQQRTLRVLEAV